MDVGIDFVPANVDYPFPVFDSFAYAIAYFLEQIKLFIFLCSLTQLSISFHSL